MNKPSLSFKLLLSKKYIQKINLIYGVSIQKYYYKMLLLFTLYLVGKKIWERQMIRSIWMDI